MPRLQFQGECLSSPPPRLLQDGLLGVDTEAYR